MKTKCLSIFFFMTLMITLGCERSFSKGEFNVSTAVIAGLDKIHVMVVIDNTGREPIAVALLRLRNSSFYGVECRSTLAKIRSTGSDFLLTDLNKQSVVAVNSWTQRVLSFPKELLSSDCKLELKLQIADKDRKKNPIELVREIRLADGNITKFPVLMRDLRAPEVQSVIEHYHGKVFVIRTRILNNKSFERAKIVDRSVNCKNGEIEFPADGISYSQDLSSSQSPVLQNFPLIFLNTFVVKSHIEEVDCRASLEIEIKNQRETSKFSHEIILNSLNSAPDLMPSPDD